jgi:dienelactone hydrolase
MKYFLILFCFFLTTLTSFSQRTVTFPSLDGLPITADIYEGNNNDPWMVLCHQADYSRGEYKETADKFVKLGYTCMAIDQRSGNEVNFVINKTALEAKERGLNTSYINVLKDIHAAVEYAYAQSKKPVVLVGSSYSASLALMLAKDNPHVDAAIVFSPGEYFNQDSLICNYIEGLEKPVFATAASDEYAYLPQLLSKMKQTSLTLYKPSNGTGKHGSKTLWPDNPTNSEYWLALLMFISQIK